MSKNKKHNHNTDGKGDFFIMGGTSGEIYETGFGAGPMWNNIWKNRVNATNTVDLDHTHTVTIDPDGGDETRPENATMTIWKRTA